MIARQHCAGAHHDLAEAPVAREVIKVERGLREAHAPQPANTSARVRYSVGPPTPRKPQSLQTQSAVCKRTDRGSRGRTGEADTQRRLDGFRGRDAVQDFFHAVRRGDWCEVAEGKEVGAQLDKFVGLSGTQHFGVQREHYVCKIIMAKRKALLGCGPIQRRTLRLSVLSQSGAASTSSPGVITSS